MINSSQSGRSVVLELKFKTDEGIDSSKIKRGTWVIAYGEIPMRKLNNDKFMIYPDCSKENLVKLERKYAKTIKRPFVPEDCVKRKKYLRGDNYVQKRH